MKRQKKALKARNNLISNYNHDLRSLLFSANGLARLMLKRKCESGGDAKEIETLRRIVDAGDNALAELKSLMGFLKLENIEKRSIPTSVFPEELIADLEEKLAPFLQESKVSLTIREMGESAPVFCDATIVKEVIQHTAFAAMELASTNTSIVVSATNNPDNKIVTLSISYSGRVLPADAMDDLFSKATPIDKFPQSAFLPVCYKYLAEEKSTMRYEGGKCGEARFLISLPVFDPQLLSG